MIKLNHDISETINFFISSLKFISSIPGHGLSLTTISKYNECLQTSPNSFNQFLKEKNKLYIEEIIKKDSILYKEHLLNQMSPISVRPFITSVKQFYVYNQKLGYITEDFGSCISVPSLKDRKNLGPISEKTEKQLLTGEWGINSIVKARNHLITCLFVRHGCIPVDLINVTEKDIHPYLDRAFINIKGKGGKPRDIQLDTITYEALKIWQIERAHFLHIKKLREDHLFISIVPKNGIYVLNKPGFQAVIRSIKNKIKDNGEDLSALNPQGLRRTSIHKDVNSYAVQNS